MEFNGISHPVYPAGPGGRAHVEAGNPNLQRARGTNGDQYSRQRSPSFSERAAPEAVVRETLSPTVSRGMNNPAYNITRPGSESDVAILRPFVIQQDAGGAAKAFLEIARQREDFHLIDVYV